jgi:putative membrane protein
VTRPAGPPPVAARVGGPVPERTAPTGPWRAAVRWAGLGALVLVQVGYPLTHSTGRAGLVVATVALGFAGSVGHAAATRGARTASALVLVTCAGGLAVEALGVRTGIPFGRYGYSGALGPRLLGVPVVIPLAWTWMAWPAWLAAVRLTSRPAARIAVAGLALAAWDLFLDPQMVADGYWHWRHPAPGLAGIPYTNYLGWLAVAVLMMASFAAAAGPAARIGDRRADAPMSALYLWTYLSSALAHAVFLHLPASAVAGAVGMGLVAVPLAAGLARRSAGAGPAGRSAGAGAQPPVRR